MIKSQHPDLNSHTQSIAQLEIQIGQLATAVSRREGEKLSSQFESNLRGQFMVESSNASETFLNMPNQHDFQKWEGHETQE